MERVRTCQTPTRKRKLKMLFLSLSRDNKRSPAASFTLECRLLSSAGNGAQRERLGWSVDEWVVPQQQKCSV